MNSIVRGLDRITIVNDNVEMKSKRKKRKTAEESKVTLESVRRKAKFQKMRDMGVTMAYMGRQEDPPISRQRVQKILGSKSKHA